MPINIEQIKARMDKIKAIIAGLDHAVTIYSNKTIYKNGNREINLSNEQKDLLLQEYQEYVTELKTEVEALPGGNQ